MDRRASGERSAALHILGWRGGCLVAGRDSPSKQCFSAYAIEPTIGFNLNAHIDDPIEAWQLTDSHFTIWPTGLNCTYVNSNTTATGTSRYITWGPSVVVLISASAAMVSLGGALSNWHRRY